MQRVEVKRKFLEISQRKSKYRVTHFSSILYDDDFFAPFSGWPRHFLAPVLSQNFLLSWESTAPNPPLPTLLPCRQRREKTTKKKEEKLLIWTSQRQQVGD